MVTAFINILISVLGVSVGLLDDKDAEKIETVCKIRDISKSNIRL